MKYKQGQTIYVIDMGYQYTPLKPNIIKYFLYSRKQELPTEACVIEKMPVDYLNELIARGGLNVTSSRRKANQRLTKLINSIKSKL